MKTLGLAAATLIFALSTPSHSQETLSVKEPMEVRGDLPAPEGEPADVRMVSLDEAIQMALAANPDVQITALNTAIAAQQVGAAKSVYEPRLFSEGQILHLDQPVASSLESSSAGAPALPFATPIPLPGQSAATAAGPLITERQAVGAGLRQTIPTGGTLELRFDNSKFETNNAFVILDPSYRSRAGLLLTQPLLRGGGLAVTAAPIVIARRSHEVSLEEFAASVSNFLNDLYGAYWELVFGVANVSVKRRSLSGAESLLEQNKARVAAGALAPVEILVAEAELATRKEDVLIAEKAQYDAADKLRVFLSPDRFSPLWRTKLLPAAEPTVPLSYPSVDQSLPKALDSRPELAAARAAIDRSQSELLLARNGVYPALGLVGGFGFTGLAGTDVSSRNSSLPKPDPRFEGGRGRSVEVLGSADFPDWQVGLTLEMPIGNEAAASRMKSATYALRQAELRLRRAEDQVRLDVREAVRSVETAKQRVKASETAEALARRKLEEQVDRQKVGLVTTHDLVQFQREADSSSVRVLRARADYGIAYSQLLRAEGSLLHETGVAIDELVSNAEKGASRQ